MKLVLITTATATSVLNPFYVLSKTLPIKIVAAATTAFDLRSSDLGLLSTFGFRPSAFPRP